MSKMPVNVEKFTFETHNFDEGAYATDKKLREQAFEKEHGVEKLTAKDIEKLKKEAFDKGFQQGRQDAVSSIEQKTSDLAVKLSQKLAEREASEEQFQLDISVDAIRLVIGALRKLYPSLDQKIGMDEKQAFLMEYLRDLDEARVIKITVHPELKDPIENVIDKVLSTTGITSKVTVIGDEVLHQNDMKIDWGYGGVEKSFEQLKKRIEQTLLESLGVEIEVPVDAPEPLEARTNDDSEEKEIKEPEGENGV